MKNVFSKVTFIILSLAALCLIVFGVIGQWKPKYQLAFQNNAFVTYEDTKTAAILLSATQATTNSVSFTKTSETVYATTNVNIRSFHSTKVNNVVSVLKKGNSIKRIGVQKEWSKVLYNNKVCYIKTTYLSLKKPMVNSVAAKDFVSNLKIAAKINQLIVVIGNGGSDSTVSYHIKDKNGIWHQQFSVDGDIGYKGITYHKKEGDKKTPAGLYSFSVAFGIKSDPGSKLPYHKVTKYDYWVDDIDSPYYNTWVNSKETPGTYRSEHLIDHSPSYNYALNIDYNSERTPGLGSAVFLHCKSGSGRTTGCVAISENFMKILLQKVDSSAKILIVPKKTDLTNY